MWLQRFCGGSCAACVFLFCACAGVAGAQSATANLRGVVVDEQGATVAGAQVTVRDAARAAERRTVTDEAGYFAFNQLAPAMYAVTVRRDDFSAVQLPNVELNVGDQSTLRVTLKIAQLGESVEVTTDAPLVGESPAVSTVVNRQFVENQPLNGRSFQTLIGLSPGVVFTPASLVSQGQFSVNGQRSNTNYFTVDGVSANFGLGPSTTLYECAGGGVPSFSAQGGTNSLASVDAVQEFAIQTSTYASEFGRQPGAQVQIVTRSGTNRLTGSVFNYLRNAVFDANNFFANANNLERPALKQNDFGFTVGGPVFLPRFGEGRRALLDGRDHTFFFVSYEGLRLRQPVVTVPLRVPSLAARGAATGVLKDLLNAFPLPTGPALSDAPNEAPYVGSFTNPSELNATSFRLDHNFSERLTLFGRYNYAPSEDVVRARFCAASCSARIPAKTETLTVGASLTFSPRVSNDLRVNYSASRAGQFYFFDNFGGAVPPPTASLFPPFVNRDNSAIYIQLSDNEDNTLTDGVFSDNRQRQFNVVNTLSYAAGAHALKFGVDYRRLAPVAGGRTFDRSYFPDSISQLASGVIASATITAVDAPLSPVFNNYSTFAQDTWRVTDRLTVTYGLRYDVNPAPSERNGLPLTITDLENISSATLAPRGTPLYATTYDNFAPRVGLAYQVFPRHGTTVRGGFGVFYDLGYNFVGTAFSPTLPPNSRRLTVTDVAITAPILFTQPPAVGFNPPYPRLFAYERNYQLPYTRQYNVAVEQALGAQSTVTATYVGANGRRLGHLTSLRGQAQLQNPSLTRVDAVTNDGTSDYHSLQVQYQRRLSRRWQALASYTWAKSLDTASDESILNFQAPSLRLPPAQDRGPSDFDVRHAASGAISYQLPAPFENEFARRVFGGFAVDSIFRARSATPVNVLTGRDPFGVGLTSVARPDVLAGVPLYLDDAQAPGSKRFNPAAFVAATPLAAGRQGTLGRNVLRGFAFYQLDVSLRRQFNLSEQVNLQLRGDAFNIFNHPNFADPTGVLPDINFGRSTRMLGTGLGGVSPLYQIGGPRSFQLAVKLQF